ncbi:hypothetical protein BKA69DRAFT_1129745 [Paraphysoderma sedebokerense]|nr:hypothetical protein BKA69DRAFT_1129745 [Paraphysoderma sedebokerense]
MDLKHLFRYADPIFLICETVNQLQHEKRLTTEMTNNLNNKIWWKTVLTTRVMLAHLTIAPDEIIYETIAGNVRNILRLFEVELSDKVAFETVNTKDVHYKQIAAGEKTVWLPLRQGGAAIIPTLTQSSFAEMQAEFDDQETAPIKNIFGHIVYRTVASREPRWKRSMTNYANLSMQI